MKSISTPHAPAAIGPYSQAIVAGNFVFCEVYGRFFGAHRPARAAVEAARLPKDALIEIECVALL